MTETCVVTFICATQTTIQYSQQNGQHTLTQFNSYVHYVSTAIMNEGGGHTQSAQSVKWVVRRLELLITSCGQPFLHSLSRAGVNNGW